ncbi:hypothetical protein BU16DRAFT_396447 [Lophium mytilinum]|uniref:F-box domain-containing protein n=1 Tax=Lophium mytilinum TaxID=390894 RepID=A0A6A6QU62_9PEZI|nr:hypothetical protein BU16DRAFT_396447 [Lophium mytilinum]
MSSWLAPWTVNSRNNRRTVRPKIDLQASPPATQQLSPYLAADMARSKTVVQVNVSVGEMGRTSWKRSADAMDDSEAPQKLPRRARPPAGAMRDLDPDDCEHSQQSESDYESPINHRERRQQKKSSEPEVVIPQGLSLSVGAQHGAHQQTKEFKNMSASVKAKSLDTPKFPKTAMSLTVLASIVSKRQASRRPLSKSHAPNVSASEQKTGARQSQKTGVRLGKKKDLNAVATANAPRSSPPAKTPRSNQNKRAKVEQSHDPIELPTASATTGPFKLMELPTEIRLMIYDYLVPDKLVPCPRTSNARTRRHSEYKSLRHDDDNCFPALLRSSQFVNAEFSYVFFGSAIFQMKVQWHAVTFLQQQYTELSLPSTLAHVKHLHISVELTMALVGAYSGGSKPANEAENSKQQSFLRMRSNLQAIGKVLADAKSIQSLGITIIDRKLRDDDVLKKSLPAILEPFQGLVRRQNFGIWFEGDYRRFQDHLSPSMKVESHPLFTAVAEEICPNAEPEVGLQLDLRSAIRLVRKWIRGLDHEIPQAKRIELFEHANEAVHEQKLDDFKQTISDALNLCHAWVQAEHKRLSGQLPQLWAQSGRVLTMGHNGTPKYIGERNKGTKNTRETKENLFQVQNAVFELEKRAFGHKIDYTTQTKETAVIKKMSKEILAELKTVNERHRLFLALHDDICAEIIDAEKRAKHAIKAKRARNEKLEPVQARQASGSSANVASQSISKDSQNYSGS